MAWTIALVVLIAAAAAAEGDADRPLPPFHDGDNGCSLGCALGWTVETVPAAIGTAPDPDWETQANFTRCWIAPIAPNPRAVFHLSAEPDHSAVPFRGFTIVGRRRQAWVARSDCCRPTAAVISASGRSVARVAIADEDGFQILRCDPVDVRGGDDIAIEFTGFTAGANADRMAVTFLVPEGGH